MASWHFTPLRPIDKIREPIQGEFFEDESISNPGEALVREGIQNSLDACPDGQTVLVRIFVSGKDQAASPSQLAPYLEGAWEHLRAEGNGLRNVPVPAEPCPFLVFEDFGTTGLVGDTSQHKPLEGVENPFFYFFRAEGRSDKSGQERGRWGVGKCVFPRASRINAIFGLTVRADDRKKLLMGEAVLRSHPVGGSWYSTAGWFGLSADEDRPVMPLDDAPRVADFCKVFDIQRGDESGLSIVVPWYNLDMTDEQLVRAVARHYFFPILTGDLEVIVETPSLKTILNAAELIPAVERIGGELVEELRPLLRLAQWARDRKEEEFLVLKPPATTGAPKWSAELIQEETGEAIRTALEKGEPVAIRVPLEVRKKNAEPEPSFFNVFIVRDGGEHSGSTVFVRKGITIAGVQPARVPGVRSLVIAEDKPLATLLGDAENPGHTKWQAGDNFKDKYVYGKSYLDFVRASVHKILQILSEEDTKADPTLLVDFFSLPAPEEPGIKTRTKKGRKSSVPKVVIPPPPPPRFRVRKVGGGFSVVPGDPSAERPRTLEIRVAYDTTHGNPLKKYHGADFQLNKAPIMLEPPPQGLDITQCERNRIVAAVRAPDFALNVTGFDENRDLYVRVVVKENTDGDSTA